MQLENIDWNTQREQVLKLIINNVIGHLYDEWLGDYYCQKEGIEFVWYLEEKFQLNKFINKSSMIKSEL